MNRRLHPKPPVTCRRCRWEAIGFPGTETMNLQSTCPNLASSLSGRTPPEGLFVVYGYKDWKRASSYIGKGAQVVI